MKRYIPSMIEALVKYANDEKNNVKNTMIESLKDIGKNEPNMVLTSSVELLDDDKVPQAHRIVLLTIITKVLEIQLDNVDEELGFRLIQKSLDEMTREKEVIPDWQSQASAVLVCLSRRFPRQIIDRLLQLFPTGEIPHYFVIKTIADMSINNAVDIVPMLGDVLARMLPVLASIKQENMKWVFANAIGCFCDAMTSYQANTTTATVPISQFAPQVFTAYELLFNNWLQVKNRKIRLATIQAIGSMCNIMTPEQFEGQLLKLLTGFLQLYKKEKEEDHLAITQGFYNILSTATKVSKIALEPHLVKLTAELFPYICKPIDYKVASALKNNNELQRCFEILGIAFTDNLLTFLLQKLESKTVSIRNGGLIILKHFVTRIQFQLAEKKEIIVAGLQTVVQNETDYLVKKSLAQLIIAMAPQGYLSLPGAESLIEFIILNSSISDAEIEKYNEKMRAKKKDKKSNKEEEEAELVSPTELRAMCDNILSLMTTTINVMEEALWPYLLEPLTKPKFSHSMGVLTKCIAYISKTKRKVGGEAYEINFEKKVNLPKPQQIFARLIVLLNYPLRRGDVGNNVLESMLQLGPIINSAIGNLWDQQLPILSNYLAQGPSKFNQDEWENQVLDLLKESIKVMDDDGWSMMVSDALLEQIPLHDGDGELKKTNIKFVGAVLQNLTHKEYIRSTLDKMFEVVDHSKEYERRGCAQGYGICSFSHLDIVLEKLIAKVKVEQKEPGSQSKSSSGGGGGLFGLFGGGSKDKKSSTTTSTGPAKVGPNELSTALLTFGYITVHANSQSVSARMEIQIVNSIRPHFENKDLTVKQTMITTADLISQSVSSEHFDADYVFNQRDEFLSNIITYIEDCNVMKDKEAADKTRVLAINAIADLVNLKPNISEEIENRLLNNITPLTLTESTDPTAELLYNNISRLYVILLTQQPTISCMTRLIGSLHSNFSNINLEVRKRAINVTMSLLKTYVKVIKSTPYKNIKEVSFKGIGSEISYFIPRCTDSVNEIRSQAIEVLQLMLYTDWILKSIAENFQKEQPQETIELNAPKSLTPLSGLKKRMAQLEDLNEQFGLIHQMAALISKLISIDEVSELLMGSINGLLDPQLPSSRGTCVVIYGILSTVGEELGDSVTKVIDSLVDKLAVIENEQTKTGILNGIKSIARHHLPMTLECLLKREIPFTPQVVKTFKFLAKENTLVQPIIDYLTQHLNNGDMFDDNPETKQQQPTHISKASTVALSEILSESDLSEVATNNFSLLFSTFVLRIGTAVGHQDAVDQVINATKNWLVCIKEEELVEKIDSSGLWSKLNNPQEYLNGVTSLTTFIIKRKLSSIRTIFKFLVPFLKGNYIGQRLVAAYTIAEFVNIVDNDAKLLDHVINCLLNSLIDTQLKIPALKGLGNIISTPAEQINKYAPTVLDALMSSIDDANDTISLEAMNGLSKVFKVVQEERISPFLINICHRIRPAFDKPLSAIRAAAAHLFESLTRFGNSEISKEAFYEQIHTNLTSIILHINDDDAEVRKAFRKALLSVAPLLGNEDLKTMLNTNYIFNVESDGDYNEFLRLNLSKALVKAFPDRVNAYILTCLHPYFESQWDTIKGNAAFFIGTLMFQIPQESRKDFGINIGHVSKELIKLLTEKSPYVRIQASVSMSLLYSY